MLVADRKDIKVNTRSFSRISRLKLFWHRLTHWEYWPFNLLYIPVFLYWPWLSFRARSFFFFTASNPGIEFGGMLGESKASILRQIDNRWLPITVKLPEQASTATAKRAMKENGLRYPVILKPDIGERGWLVAKINSEEDLHHYLSNTATPQLLLQEYVDEKIELGIFYCRLPGSQSGKVTSVVMKKMLTVQGDGEHSIEEFIQSDYRSLMQEDQLRDTLGDEIHRIPEPGELIELVPIGNHCKGTTFLNANHLINHRLPDVFDEISQTIEGFYYGRFDLRCDSIESLYLGNFKIMELNGAGAEPSHIYDPKYKLSNGYRDIFQHLNLLAKISIENQQRGVRPQTFAEGLATMRKIRSFNNQYGK